MYNMWYEYECMIDMIYWFHGLKTETIENNYLPGVIWNLLPVVRFDQKPLVYSTGAFDQNCSSVMNYTNCRQQQIYLYRVKIKT